MNFLVSTPGVWMQKNSIDPGEGGNTKNKSVHYILSNIVAQHVQPFEKAVVHSN